jgi:8-oxo-dGTP pyrophosphatase MutT (NUDIX family)
MRQIKSCGCVIFSLTGGKREYLLLHHPEGHWDFPKGHVEKGESEEETALREIYEETGLKGVVLMHGFRHAIAYKYLYDGKQVSKRAVYFLAMTARRRIKLSGEHTDSAWLPYDEALKRLTFRNAKNTLDYAEKFMKHKEKMLLRKPA